MSASVESRVTRLLCDLIALPSVNPMGRELTGPEYFEGRMTEFLALFFQQLGVPHEVQVVEPGRANVLARFDSPGSTLTLMLDAHQDTVTVDGMTIPPFEPSIRDGRVYGRGSCDVKGGMASMLCAFERLVRERPAGAASVIMCCSCDEEMTAKGIRAVGRLWNDQLGQSRIITRKPDGAVMAEPTLLDVVVAHRGASRFRIRTPGRACHSSDPTQGINAIYRMARVITCLEEYAAALPRQVPPHPLCGGATISVGRIYGGASVNVVPDECAIEIDRRIVPGENPDAAIRDIHEYLKARLDFEFIVDPPWLDGATLNDTTNAWLADGLLKSVARIDGPHRAVGVPYGTNASRSDAAGLSSVVFGPGSIAQAHTKDEWVEISQLVKAAETYFDFCCHPPTPPG